MLAEPLAVGPQLGAVALAPEPLEVVGAALAAGAVELPQDAVARDGQEIAAVAGDGGRVVARRALEVRRHAVEPAQQEERPRHLELAEAGIGALRRQVAVEGDEGGVAVAHLALDPPARQHHRRVGGGGRGGRAAQGVERHVELDVDPLPERGVGEVHQALVEAGIHLGGLGEGHRRAGEGVLAQHGLDAGDEGDLRVADAVLGEPHPVVAVGPGGLEIDGPLELGGRILIVRLSAELAQPEGQEAEPEVDHRVVAVGLGLRDQPLLQRQQADRVRGRGHGVAEPLQLGTLRRGLAAERQGGQPRRVRRPARGSAGAAAIRCETGERGEHLRDPHSELILRRDGRFRIRYWRRPDAATAHKAEAGGAAGPRAVHTEG